MQGVTNRTLRTIVCEELASRLRQGNISAEEEDQIIACFEKAYSSLDQLRARDLAGIRAWLNAIISNIRIDAAVRANKWGDVISLTEVLDTANEPAGEGGDPLSILVGDEQLRYAVQVHAALQHVLAGLDPATAWMFRCRFYYRVPFAQIAVRLKISEHAAIMRYQRLRDRVFRQVHLLLRTHSPAALEFFTHE